MISFMYKVKDGAIFLFFMHVFCSYLVTKQINDKQCIAYGMENQKSKNKKKNQRVEHCIRDEE